MSQILESWAKIFHLAWPLIVANGFWNIQLSIDRFFLSQYSTYALGAAVTVMGVFWTPMALLQQTAAYVMTFVAQYHGARKYAFIGPFLWQSFYASLIGGSFFLFLIPPADFIFSFFGHPPELHTLEVSYFRSVCYSALPTAFLAAISGYYTGLGKTQIIILLNAIGMVINTLFDYLWIFGKAGFPQMGIEGAGYATSVANFASALVGFFLLFREKKSSFRLFSWQFRPKLFWRFIRYGVPAGSQWALEGLAFTVFLIFMGKMRNGTVALSASGIAVTLMMLAILPAMGIAQAISSLVAHKLGEENAEQAERILWGGYFLTIAYMGLVSISFFLFPEFYLEWFNSADPNWPSVFVYAKILLLYAGLFNIFDASNMVFSFCLKGAGDTRFVFLVALLLPWPIMVLPTFFLQTHTDGVYLAWGFALCFSFTQAMVFAWRVARGRWKNIRVIS
ncbi:MAG: MATE family efflux transporter [Leptospiraceae bacterium]|nr:MATE family efflux transporter [Leptospiraceae bacterium]MDW8305566.1 MATE family efflux transporter [Leptospiraceae bacterium]